jgi:RNase P/RNase MRP subunit POP5
MMTVEELMAELAEVQNEIKGLQERFDIIREELLKHAQENGGKIVAPGFGTVAVITPKPRMSFKAEDIENFIIECTRNGDMHTAAALADMRKASEPKPYVTFKKEW